MQLCPGSLQRVSDIRSHPLCCCEPSCFQLTCQWRAKAFSPGSKQYHPHLVCCAGCLGNLAPQTRLRRCSLPSGACSAVFCTTSRRFTSCLQPTTRECRLSIAKSSRWAGTPHPPSSTCYPDRGSGCECSGQGRPACIWLLPSRVAIPAAPACTSSQLRCQLKGDLCTSCCRLRGCT